MGLPQLDRALGDLNAQILGGWWSLGLEALIDALGREGASESVRPFMEHSARSGYLFLRSRLGIEREDMRSLCVMGAMGHQLLRKDVSRVRVHDDDFGILEFEECPFEGCDSLACVTACYQIKRAFAAQCDPAFRGDLPLTIKNGDERCEIHISRIGAALPGEDGWEEVRVDMSVFSAEERDWFFRSYMGEFWLNAVRALGKAMGEDGAVSYLAPRMRGSGMSLALGLKEELGLQNGLRGASSALHLINLALSQDGELVEDGAQARRTIVSCPFKQASPSVCALVQAFLDGARTALGPELGYRCEKGDDHAPCHWTLQDAHGTSDGGPADEAARGPLSRLRERLANGDISPEEYSQLARLVSE